MPLKNDVLYKFLDKNSTSEEAKNYNYAETENVEENKQGKTIINLLKKFINN